jgi:uncharacterized protein YndB with AHSA1/START domain
MSDRCITHSTFTLERTYPVPPSQVFQAWADPEIKARWFAGNAPGYELDFRPGGVERNRGTHDGQRIAWESLYREIVTDERIVYSSVLSHTDTVATVSMSTVELVSVRRGEVTHLVLVETGAYLDGREHPSWREQGTSDWLDALGAELGPRPAG